MERESAQGAITVGKGIKPENGVGYQLYDNQPWDAFEWERVVATSYKHGLLWCK